MGKALYLCYWLTELIFSNNYNFRTMKIFKVLPLFMLTILFSNISGNAQNTARLQKAQLAPVAQVAVTDVASLLEEGAIMVDVRETSEVAALAYNVEGIVNIPLSELTERMSELPTDKKLIMACRSGNRSTRALNLLAQNGYTDLVNLSGGMKAWQNAGLAVTAANAPAAKSCSGAAAASCHKGGQSAKSCSGAAAKSCSGSKKTSCCSKKGADVKAVEPGSKN